MPHDLAQHRAVRAARHIAETFEKGENVRIVGTLLSRQFTPKDGSKPRTVWEVVAREAYVIAPRRGGKAAPAALAPSASKPSPSDDDAVMAASHSEAASEDGSWV